MVQENGQSTSQAAPERANKLQKMLQSTSMHPKMRLKSIAANQHGRNSLGTNPAGQGERKHTITHGFRLPPFPSIQQSNVASSILSSLASATDADKRNGEAAAMNQPSAERQIHDNTKAVVDINATSTAMVPPDRLQRSRERNRIHARKTRQRKKEQMQTLQGRADGLKEEQIRLKQIINEKNTASILVGLFSRQGSSDPDSLQLSDSPADPAVEALLQRPVDEIPDASKINELPALILPGQHASKKLKAEQCQQQLQLLPSSMSSVDGIDYELLGKDRSKCTPEELDQIRRERNRMHAKRTRDRKRHLMEEMSAICNTLESENDLLRQHLATIDPNHEAVVKHYYDNEQHDQESTLGNDNDTATISTKDEPESRSMSPAAVLHQSSPKLLPLAPKFNASEVSTNPSVSPTKSAGAVDQFQTLLEAIKATQSTSTASYTNGVVSKDPASSTMRPCASVSSDDSDNNQEDNRTPRRSITTKRKRTSTLSDDASHPAKKSSPSFVAAV